MPITWSPALSVGVPEIDAQHEELFTRFAMLLAAMRAGIRHEGGHLLTFLGNYLVEHFEAEERLMRATGYPELAAHVKEHEAITERYRRLKERFDERGPTALLTLDLNETVGGWAKAHIPGSDLQMASFLKA